MPSLKCPLCPHMFSLQIIQNIKVGVSPSNLNLAKMHEPPTVHINIFQLNKQSLNGWEVLSIRASLLLFHFCFVFFFFFAFNTMLSRACSATLQSCRELQISSIAASLVKENHLLFLVADDLYLFSELLFCLSGKTNISGVKLQFPLGESF